MLKYWLQIDSRMKKKVTKQEKVNIQLIQYFAAATILFMKIPWNFNEMWEMCEKWLY